MGRLRFVDFFAGVGGIRLGLERAGHECVWACEIDPFARAIYEARFGHAPQGCDIRDVRPEDIPDADLWSGGFPCQDLSTAGRRAGLTGTRSGLIWTMLDLARVKRPKWILLENVPGLLSGKDSDDEDSEGAEAGGGELAAYAAEPVRQSWFGALLGALADCGFVVGAWRVLDARHAGVPQRRRRVFVAARRAGDGPDPAEVLSLSEGVSGRAPSRSSSRARTSRTAQASSRSGGELAYAVCARDGKGPTDGGGRDNFVLAPPHAATLTSGNGVTGNDPGRRREDDENLVAHTVQASAGHHGRSSPRGDGCDNLVVANTVQAHHPRNAPDDQLVPVGSFYPTAGSGNGGSGWTLNGSPPVKVGTGLDISSPPAVVLAAFDMAQVTSDENRGARCDGDKAPTLAAAGRPHVAYNVNAAHSCAEKDHAIPTDHARCLDQNGGFAANQGGTVVAAPVAGAIQASNGGADDNDAAQGRLVALAQCHGGDVGEFGTLRAGRGDVQSGVPFMGVQTAVRRLTPMECERLQGLPDNWTLIRWDSKRETSHGATEWASDSKRYKVVGNSVAVPVLTWIGRRLAMLCD